MIRVLYKNAYTISFYNLNSYFIFKLTVWAEFRVAVDCRGSPATVSQHQLHGPSYIGRLFEVTENPES